MILSPALLIESPGKNRLWYFWTPSLSNATKRRAGAHWRKNAATRALVENNHCNCFVPVDARRNRPKLSGETDQNRGAVCAGRRERRDCARRQPTTRAAARPAGDRRKPRRCGRRGGCGCRRALDARWLHAAARQSGPERDQSVASTENAVRSDSRFFDDHADG